MTNETKRRFAVISNDSSNAENDINNYERRRRSISATPPDTGYHTNPMYEKLLNFKEREKKKRFTVEDLLKWC